MFTGIIEKTARVIGVADGPTFRRLTVAVDWGDLRQGESIAVNGACLTVAELSAGAAGGGGAAAGEVGFDVVRETLDRTNLGLLAQGDSVHLERALRVGDRIDGHFVQGHVDGTATLLRQASDDREWRLVLEAPPALAKYIIPKGSVALDGVSLTIASVKGNVFEVALIPTTLRLTMLGRRPAGWPFNLEADLLSKTVIARLEHLERGGGGAEDTANARRAQPSAQSSPQPSVRPSACG